MPRRGRVVQPQAPDTGVLGRWLAALSRVLEGGPIEGRGSRNRTSLCTEETPDVGRRQQWVYRVERSEFPADFPERLAARICTLH